MDSEFGLFGGGWQDYHDKNIKPVLDDLDRQMSDIRINGAEGQLARMQAQDDAGVGGGGAYGAAMLPIGANQQDGLWYSPFGASNTGGNPSSPSSHAPVPADATDKSKLFGGIADAFGDAGLMADAASAGAAYLGKTLGNGSTAALRGLEDVTRHIISTPLTVAEGVANTFKDAADGYTPAESILGNVLRTGTVYGGGALAGMASGPAGPIVGFGLDEALPSGGAIGRSILHPPASQYDFPTTVMLRAK